MAKTANPARAWTRERRRIMSDVRKVRETLDDENTITLTNGIVLHLRPLSQGAIRRARAAIQKPAVPAWVDPEDSARREENPDDPDYQAALALYYQELLTNTFRMMVMLGTEFVSAPEGMFGPDEDGWVELMEASGVPIAFTNPSERRWEWMDSYALDTPADRAMVTAALLPRLGIMDQEVREAVATFRSDPERRADRDVPVEAADPDGSGVGGDLAGDGDGVGGTAGGSEEPVQLGGVPAPPAPRASRPRRVPPAG